MDVIVLAAGYATRMYPLTEHFPKPLLPVSGRPILDWLLADAARLPGMDRVIVVSNHRFIDAFSNWADGLRLPLPVVLLDDGSESNQTRRGAVRDILFAREETGATDDALVMAGDNVLEFSLSVLVEFYREKRASCVLCYEEPDMARRRRAGVLVCDENDRVISFEEKPEQPKGVLLSPPFYCFTAADLDRIPAALACGCPFDAPGNYAAYVSRESLLYACRMPGKRHDIGSLEGYRAIQREVTPYAREGDPV